MVLRARYLMDGLVRSDGGPDADECAAMLVAVKDAARR